MKINPKTILINIFFIATTVMCLYTVIVEDYDLKIVFKPLPLLGLTFLYISKVTKINYWILASLMLSVIADAVFTVDRFFIEGLVLFTVVQLILVKIIVSYFRAKVEKVFYRYLLMFLLCFFVIFYFLFDNISVGIPYYVIFVYGTVTSLLAAVSFTNYLNRLTITDLILFGGVFLNVISNCILGVNLFGESSIYFTFSALLLYFISHYIIYNSLILKSE